DPVRAGADALLLVAADQVTRLQDQGAAWTQEVLPLPFDPPTTTTPATTVHSVVVDAAGDIYLVAQTVDYQHGTYQYALYRYAPAELIYRTYLPLTGRGEFPAPPPNGQVAVDRINAWRAVAGLAPVQDQLALRCAAENHAHYLALNYAATGEPHYESPDRPGFTGERPSNRSAYCGYPDPWDETGEVAIIPPGIGAAAAVDEWLAMVYHRCGVLDPPAREVGYGEGGANVLDYRPGPATGGTWAAPRQTRFAQWPIPGQADVPRLWNGYEIPDPLPAGAARPVGYPVSLTWDRGVVTPTQALLTSPTGTVPCHPLPPTPIYGGDYYVFLVPIAPLAPRTTYTATVAGASPDGPFAFTWSFTTTAATIAGRVTVHEEPAGGVVLELRRLVDDGPAYTVVATTTTDLAGQYRFLDPPLTSADTAWVAYQNDGEPGRLSYWSTWPFNFDPGGADCGGDLELGDVALGEPHTTQQQPAPITFHWTPRGVAGETYTIQFRDPVTDEFRARVDLTAAESAAGWVALPRPADLPHGLYAWTIRVEGPTGGGRAGTTHLVRW
ncbi:MAG: hypothetical protein KJ734_07045, partial [Chloroflexi bacterium]|nr:hypothetical protein [Chloroflexota bacterium]